MSSYLDNSSICMQHSIIVLSVISAMLSMIATLFGAYQWYHWTPIITVVIVTFIGVPAAYLLMKKLLIVYAVLDGADFILKVFIIGSLIYYKIKIGEDCSPFDTRGNEDDCPNQNWRILLINITSAVVFYIFSAIIQIILFTFAIYLIFSIKKYKPFYIENDAILQPNEDIEDLETKSNV